MTFHACPRAFLTNGAMALGFGFLLLSRPIPAQEPIVGDVGGVFAGNANPSNVETFFHVTNSARVEGTVTSARFGWSRTGCPAAVKIKFFRIGAVVPRPNELHFWDFVAERGPFDVTSPLTTTSSGPAVIQTVDLVPPVNLKAGDAIAITNVTSCGGPTLHRTSGYASFAYPGDIVTTIAEPPTGTWSFDTVDVMALGTTSSLFLLDRFSISLSAVDPRSGRQTVGSSVSIESAAGYFSLPDFTGDPVFPEIMVKMVDATRSPSLGGDFWFFHASLTDVLYTLTVQDRATGAVKTYSNIAGSPGQLCGAADTSAFPP